MSLPGNQLVTLAALGAGAYLLLDKEGGPATGSLTPPSPTNAVIKDRTGYDNTKDLLKALHRQRTGKAYQYPGPISTTPANEAGNGGSQSGLPADVEQQILNDLKKSWEAASGEAKVAVCRRMKAQFPNNAAIQAMNCADAPNMAFQAVVTVVGAAIGGAVCGPPCSVVGSLVAAWAGPKLEEWAESAWNKAKDWGEELWPGNWNF